MDELVSLWRTFSFNFCWFAKKSHSRLVQRKIGADYRCPRCALRVTVSTSNSCCCPLQLFRVVAHWVAMRSWSLVRLNTSLERSVEPPLACMCSLDKENLFPRIDNAEITDSISTSRETTRSPARLFAARSFLVSCPPGTMVSSYRRSSLSLLAANSSGCFFGKASHSPGSVPVWCLHEQESLESDEPPGSLNCCHCSAVSLERWAGICICCRCLTGLVFANVITSFSGNTKGKLFTKLKKVTANISSTYCMLQGSTVQTAYAVSAPLPLSFCTFTCPAWWPARQLILECSAGKRPISCEQTTDTTVS